MARKKLIAGNWKMNCDLGESLLLVANLKELVDGISEADMLICPPSTNLNAIGGVIADTTIQLGAQNMHWEDNGAFTGEVSAKMLASVGCSHVIIGHSERRRDFGETDQIVNLKTKAALSNGLIPIVCVGESKAERSAGKQNEVVESQLNKGLEGLSLEDASGIIIAYEPLWAISGGDPTHKAATPQDGQDMHEFIRSIISKLYGEELSNSTIILYGGSVKPANAKEILSMPDIDGALVGGASLVAEDFVDIVKSCR